MHRPRFRPALTVIALLLACALQLVGSATAQPLADEPRAEPVRREILAIYDSREEPRPDQTRIHRFAEMPLNHLGFAVSYWDINTGIPGSERTDDIRGIITWLRRPPPAAFYVWGQQQVARGNRMVVKPYPTASTAQRDSEMPARSCQAGTKK